jgi:hypothetical protein
MFLELRASDLRARDLEVYSSGNVRRGPREAETKFMELATNTVTK